MIIGIPLALFCEVSDYERSENKQLAKATGLTFINPARIAATKCYHQKAFNR
jgi:hypothetical protein